LRRPGPRGYCGKGALRVGLLAAVGVLVAPEPARSHDVDVTSVARVFLDEVGEGRYMLSVVDAKVPGIAEPGSVLPTRCQVLPPDAAELLVVSGFVFACAPSLTADDVLVLPWSLAGVVVVARWSDGSGGSAFFRGVQGSVRVRLAELRSDPGSLVGLAGTYLALGSEHILLGVDHLLFVFGLLLLVRGLAPLVKTVTAFTLAHSVTLAASVLGYIPLDRAPIEAAIALSIVLLAREIVVAEHGRAHLTHRMPWLVSFVFGLLHGLGFAGALGEIGLPDGAVPPALLFFNLGVEVGQLAFVMLSLGVYYLLRGRLTNLAPKARPALGYSIGALATMWFFQRVPALWGG